MDAPIRRKTSIPMLNAVPEDQLGPDDASSANVTFNGNSRATLSMPGEITPGEGEEARSSAGQAWRRVSIQAADGSLGSPAGLVHGAAKKPDQRKFKLVEIVKSVVKIKGHREKRLFYDGLVVNPRSQYYAWWLRWTTFLTPVFVLVMPIRLAFMDESLMEEGSGLESLLMIETIIDICFGIDILINFRLATTEFGRVVTDPKTLACNYLRFKFWVDLVSCFPFGQIFGAFFDRKGGFILELLGMLRFVRITRLVYAMRRAEQNFKYNYNMLVLLKFLIILMMSGHLSGCGLYLIARIHFFDPETTWVGAFVPTLPQQPLARQYVTSVYWGMTTLTTVGYGDLSPVGAWERVFCMLIMIVNLAISAYILGNMTLLATRQDAQTADNRGHLHDLHTFMRMRSIPDALCRHALKHMQLSHVLAKDSDAILDQCPTFIRVKLLRHLYRDAFVKQPLFASARDQFIGQLVSALNVENFFPGDFIFSAGDEPDAFYCIVEGSVETRPPLSRDHNSTLAPGSTLGPRIAPQASVEPQELEREAQAKTAQSSGGVFRKLGPGMMFGEAAVICDFAQPWSARSKTLSRTLQVKRVSWQALATKFPREITRCQQVLLSQIQGELARTGLDESDDGLPVYRDETLMDVLTSVKTGMATHVQDLVTMLCFAASRGDHMEVRRLIKGAGLHPNDGDYDGRAAIHLAAVGGHLETIQFLLEHGADPSLGDNFGTTPLQESVSRGHTKVSELLRKLGGELLLPNAGGKLCSLAFEAHTKELRNLLQYGVHPDSCDYDFRTPLHLACAEGVLPCVKVLLEFKADVNFKDRWGQTALDEAYAGNHKRIVKYLEGRGGLRGSGSPGQGSTWARSHSKVLKPPVSRSNPRSPIPPGKTRSNSINPQLQDSKERMRRDTVNLAGGNLLEQWL